MAEYNGQRYRLRAGSPMPISNSGEFVLHSFMAERHDIAVDTCTSSILGSGSFKGQGGSYISASYNRLPVADERFRSEKSTGPGYVEEDDFH